MPPRMFGFQSVFHEDAPHSCKHCERITITEQHIRESEHLGALIRLPHTISEAKLAAKDGCPLFYFHVRFFTRFTPGVMVAEMWTSLKRCFSPWKKIKSDLNIGNDYALRFPEPLDNSWRLDKTICHISTRWKYFKYILSHFCRRHLYIVLIRNSLRMHYLARTELTYGMISPLPRVLYDVTTSSGMQIR
jgi:hypothetical protein